MAWGLYDLSRWVMLRTIHMTLNFVVLLITFPLISSVAKKNFARYTQLLWILNASYSKVYLLLLFISILREVVHGSSELQVSTPPDSKNNCLPISQAFISALPYATPSSRITSEHICFINEVASFIL